MLTFQSRTQQHWVVSHLGCGWRNLPEAKVYRLRRTEFMMSTYIFLQAVTNASYLEVHGFGLERFVERRVELKEGRAIAPDVPGHGVKLDLCWIRRDTGKPHIRA